MRCVYHQCGAPAVVAAQVLSGDADEMHSTLNPLCSVHSRHVIRIWIDELIAGGPVQSITLTRPERVEKS